jgi:hypothetical protein
MYLQFKFKLKKSKCDFGDAGRGDAARNPCGFLKMTSLRESTKLKGAVSKTTTFAEGTSATSTTAAQESSQTNGKRSRESHTKTSLNASKRFKETPSDRNARRDRIAAAYEVVLRCSVSCRTTEIGRFVR